MTCQTRKDLKINLVPRPKRQRFQRETIQFAHVTRSQDFLQLNCRKAADHPLACMERINRTVAGALNDNTRRTWRAWPSMGFKRRKIETPNHSHHLSKPVAMVCMGLVSVELFSRIGRQDASLSVLVYPSHTRNRARRVRLPRSKRHFGL